MALCGFGLGLHLHALLSHLRKAYGTNRENGMAKTLQEVGYRTYWSTWLLLLVLTLVMLAIGYVSLPKVFMVFLLVPAMLVKASLIGAHFMHLRFERLNLVLTVAVGILATGTILFLLISFDGIRILTLSLH